MPFSIQDFHQKEQDWESYLYYNKASAIQILDGYTNFNLFIDNTRTLMDLLEKESDNDNDNDKEGKNRTFPTIIDRFVRDITRRLKFEKMWLKYKEDNFDLSMGID